MAQETTQPPYYTIEQMLAMVDEPNRTICFKILLENKKLFQTVQGSTHNHQAWQGGYHDHVQEIMNIAAYLYPHMCALRPLPFSLSDAFLVLFLHDIEKPWKYEIGPDGELQIIPALRAKDAQHEFRSKELTEYGIVLTPEQKNGMRYVEGEFDDYTSRSRVMGPLAAFCHMCDVWSARGWFDHPLAQNDSWSGARRMRD